MRMLTAAFALTAGLAAGLACGATTRTTGPRPLPRAGDPDDDGTGFLARWSRGEKARGGVRYGGAYVDDDGYDGYGGGHYGGYDLYFGDGVVYGGLIVGDYPPPVYEPAPAQTAPNYTQMAVHNGGVIEGVVTWKRAPRVPATLGAPGAAGCANPSLRVSPSGGVAGAVVYLADIRVGKPPAFLGGVLEQSGCALAPHVQIAAPIGAVLQVSNRDVSERRLSVRRWGWNRPESPVDLVVGPGAQRPVVLKTDGVYEIAAADQPGAVAWVVVPRHPYYAITDETGHFRIDDVPPGEYKIVVWHEPVATGMDARTGQAVRGAPIEVWGTVKVVAGATTLHAVDLK